MESPGKEPKKPGKATVLIVDDEPAVRESLSMILKPLYEVHTASDGQEALRVIRERDIEVVTLDLHMPGLSGIEVLKAIKELRPETEVIIVTGYGSLRNASEAIRLGVGNFISKPFNVSEIISAITKAVERRLFNSKLKGLTENLKNISSPADSLSSIEKKEEE